jgi:hypothetical protein
MQDVQPWNSRRGDILLVTAWAFFRRDAQESFATALFPG